MVGIRVGGTNSGLEVGSTVAVAVGLGVGVNVAVSEGMGEGIVGTVCPHAMNNKLMVRRIIVRKTFFIMAHSLGTTSCVLPKVF